MSSPIIRERTDEDLAAAAAVLVDVYREDGYPVEGVDDPFALLQPSGVLHAWVAVFDGRVVGHAVVTSPPSSNAAVKAWIAAGGDLERTVVAGRLFVHPTARGLRVGARLASAIADWTDLHEYDLVALVLEKDRAAIRLYERSGWQRIGIATHRTSDGSPFPALLFARSVPQPEPTLEDFILKS